MDSHAHTIQNAKQKGEYQKVAASMVEKLKSMHYHGSYFDRTEKKLHRLCTKEGWFSCQVPSPLQYTINAKPKKVKVHLNIEFQPTIIKA